jgi:hypothetical protein
MYERALRSISRTVARMRLLPSSSTWQNRCILSDSPLLESGADAGPMSPLTSTWGLPNDAKRYACTALAASTRERMADDGSPPSRLDSFAKGTRITSR